MMIPKHNNNIVETPHLECNRLLSMMTKASSARQAKNMPLIAPIQDITSNLSLRLSGWGIGSDPNVFVRCLVIEICDSRIPFLIRSSFTKRALNFCSNTPEIWWRYEFKRRLNQRNNNVHHNQRFHALGLFATEPETLIKN